MLLLLAACATAVPTDPGNCGGAPIPALDVKAFRAAIPADAVTAEDAAGSDCLGSFGHEWTLSRPVEIQGIPCQSAITTFGDTPELAECTLAREACVGGVLLAGGSDVRWLPGSGQLVRGRLAVPATIEGVRCDEGYVTVPYAKEDGTCRLQPDTLVDGYPCEKSAHFGVGGQLDHCRLRPDAVVPIARERRPASAADVDLACRHSLSFRDGVLQACRLAAPAVLDGVRVEAGEDVTWIDGVRSVR